MVESTSLADIKSRLRRALADSAAPALGMDGAAVELLDFADGVARVRLSGTCGCCPGSVHALLHGLETELRRLVPELDYLEVVP